MHDIKPEEVQRWIDNKVNRQIKRDLEFVKHLERHGG
jgi:hypothetical protein